MNGCTTLDNIPQSAILLSIKLSVISIWTFVTEFNALFERKFNASLNEI